ncbi:alkaline phosphatase D family protein [Candidatus Halobonum tyrrellensis]|uniref:Alkaline phosphatase n=1 Tax=Candidatus Halobonum tyrrellensis G22 TaxID=1324957 RepID=V4HG52_9EURY|nr:alkaline phosphatase D family protein [Candidatus Halobonum tyrrellensis]ESP89098.1 Alkaline phosphatase [Candidatus Halobonum tyrrellensis G22]
MGGEATPDVRPEALADAAGAADAAVAADDAAAGDVFPQSVASGGPTPEGVVLWTRLDPERYDPAEPVVVAVADTENGDDAGGGGGFADPVLAGRVPDDRVGEAYGHTVRIDVDGRLESDTEYRYRFVHDGVASRTGRCRTLPTPDASPESVRFGVVGCQDYENGYYGGFAHVADEDVDFLLHTGDLIYESAGGLFAGSDRPTGRDLTLPSGHDRASSLADYRYLHRTYRSDPLYQRALEAHTLIASWDDHAVSNDRYWDDAADAPALPDHPRGDDPAFAERLTAAGTRAWYEHVPARVRYDPEEAHLHDSFRLYRSLRFGDLLDLLVTDHRFYRDGPPPDALSLFGATFGLGREGAPDRSMLGADQFDWFDRRVREADGRWLGWVSAVTSVPFRVGAGRLSVYPKADSTWDGFPAERRRAFDALADADPSVVTVSGDLHSYVVGTQLTEGTRGDAVGTEFMGPAMTSVNIAESLGVAEGLAGRLTRALFGRGVPAMNPQTAFFDTHDWGYAVVEFSRESCTYTAYAVDKTVDDADADRRPVARYRRPHDRPTVEPDALPPGDPPLGG